MEHFTCQVFSRVTKVTLSSAHMALQSSSPHYKWVLKDSLPNILNCESPLGFQYEIYHL